MTNQRYDIYFSGRLIAGEAESDVRERLTRRLRIDGQQVAQLFASGTVVVKRNVDLDTAARYRVLFRDAGAIIDIKEAEAPARTESYSRDPGRTVCGLGDGSARRCGLGWGFLGGEQRFYPVTLRRDGCPAFRR